MTGTTAVLPGCAVGAWWLSAWLRGAVSPDDLMASTGLGVGALAALRASGSATVGLALPVEGDPLGLGGPADFNAAALAAGEALVGDGGLGLVPGTRPDEAPWTTYDAHRRQIPDVGEADRGLRAAILDCARALAVLDVARWRPEVADEILALGRPGSAAAPPGTPPRCVELAVKAARCRAIVALALADDGAAVSAGEAASRRAALTPLERASRRALVAACSPEVWPPGP
jgi:hypothetical protein